MFSSPPSLLSWVRTPTLRGYQRARGVEGSSPPFTAASMRRSSCGYASCPSWSGSAIRLQDAEGGPTLAVLWIANIIAAVLFGLGHLPATAASVALTPLVVTRALVLNGLGGVGFGYLYMKHGLESAMIAHFSADIVLHVLLPSSSQRGRPLSDPVEFPSASRWYGVEERGYVGLYVGRVHEYTVCLRRRGPVCRRPLHAKP